MMFFQKMGDIPYNLTGSGIQKMSTANKYILNWLKSSNYDIATAQAML